MRTMGTNGLRVAAVTAVAVAFCALPGTALGAAVEFDDVNGILSITAPAGETNDLSVTQPQVDEIAVVDAGVAPTAGTNCTTTGQPPNTVLCTAPAGAFNPATDSYQAVLEDGADKLRINAAVLLPGSAFGGAGADTIEGGGGGEFLDGEADGDVVEGGPGDDIIQGLGGDDTLRGEAGGDDIDGGIDSDMLQGGDGDDNLSDDLGSDTLQGGDGDDSLSDDSGTNTLEGGAGEDNLAVAGTSADVVRGGAGFDFGFLRFDGPAAEAAALTLDDVANDGRTGEGKNFHADIEAVGVFADADDTSTLGGNAAANVLQGGSGSDDIDPGGGTDIVLAGAGDDIVRTADGVPDTVACGSGADSATVDQFDSVDGCENVTTQQVPSPFAGAAPAVPAPAPAPAVAGEQVTQVVEAARDARAPAFSSLSVPARLTRQQLRRGVSVRFAVDETSSAEIALTGRLRRGTIARAGDLVLAERALGRGAGRRAVNVKLGRAALRALPRRGRFRLRVQVTLVDAAGNRRTQARTITVR